MTDVIITVDYKGDYIPIHFFNTTKEQALIDFASDSFSKCPIISVQVTKRITVFDRIKSFLNKLKGGQNEKD